MKGLEIQVKGKIIYLNWNNKIELNAQLICRKQHDLLDWE